MNELTQLNQERATKVENLRKAKEAFDSMQRLKSNKDFMKFEKRFKDTVMEAVVSLTDSRFSKEEANEILIGYSVLCKFMDEIENDYTEFQNTLNQHDAYVMNLTEFEGA